MKTSLAVAADLLREAASRKWFIGLAAAITLALGTLTFSLKLDVVDGALAASRFFGHSMHGPVQAVDVVIRPIFEFAAYVTFYIGLLFGVLACADFAPSLLSPGRIEHLLALPVRRVELLAGTFLGVLVLALGAAVYGAGGLTLIFGVKAHVWTWGPIVAALLAVGTFTAIYAAMLATALFARSAAVSSAVGMGLFILGIIAGHREKILGMFAPGVGRSCFAAITLMVPRVSSLAEASAAIASSAHLELRSLTGLMAGVIVFALGLLSLAAWRFEQKDF